MRFFPNPGLILGQRHCYNIALCQRRWFDKNAIYIMDNRQLEASRTKAKPGAATNEHRELLNVLLMSNKCHVSKVDRR